LYKVYYGASDLGKSLAIQHALSNRKGVIYLPLREATSASLPTLFSRSIGYHGNRIDEKTPDLVLLLAIFKESVKQFKTENRMKVIVFTDDIHHEKDTLLPESGVLAKFFLGLYNEGYINNVYSVSDYQAIPLLRSLSGHSTRMSSELFPSIPDEDLKKDLLELSLSSQFDSLGVVKPDITVDYTQYSFDWAFIERDRPTNSTNFVFRFDKEVNYLVERLDSHLGEVTKVLKSVVTKEKSVEQAVDSIIQEGMPDIASALFGESCGDVDEETFILTTWILLQELEKSDIVKWEVVSKKSPKLADTEIKRAVNQLVKKNILSYVDWYTVCFHRRSLKYAYLLSKEEPTQRDRFEKIKAKVYKE